jgi:GMP synthase (glutamine-hydrolysing)
MSKIHLVDVTDFTLPDGSASPQWFEEAFEALGISSSSELAVYDGMEGRFPDLAEASAEGHGIIISSSWGMISDDKDWIPPLLEFVKAAHEAGAWLLGICYGQHALAVALGGEVAYNTRGREMGTVPVYLTPEGEKSPLFEGFTSGDPANLVHMMHVTKMPEGAERLAFSQMTPNQAFRIGRSFGYQPHPEFTPDHLEQLARMTGDYMIRREGFLDDAEHLENFLKTFRDTPSSRAILRNFADMTSNK